MALASDYRNLFRPSPAGIDSPRRSPPAGRALAAILRPHVTLSNIPQISASPEGPQPAPTLSQPSLPPSRVPRPPETPELLGHLVDDPSRDVWSPPLSFQDTLRPGRPSLVASAGVVGKVAEHPRRRSPPPAGLQFQESVGEAEHLMKTSSGVSVMATPR